jgi:hypothetical protein
MSALSKVQMSVPVLLGTLEAVAVSVVLTSKRELNRLDVLARS